MKRKALVIFGLFALAFSLASCGNTNSESSSQSTSSGSSVPVSAYYYLYIDEYSTTDPYDTVLYLGSKKRVNHYLINGYNFQGYFTERNGAGEEVTTEDGNYLKEGLTLANKTALYGYYTLATYTVTYYCSIGQPTGENPTSYTIDSPDLTLYPYAATGYTFGGWYTSSDFQEGTLISTIKHGSHNYYHLYGKMVPIVVELTLSTIKVIHVNYYVGTTLYLSGQYRESSLVYPPTNPTVANKYFLGWYFDEAFTTRCEFNTTITADTSLYAKFAENVSGYDQFPFKTRTAVNAPLAGYTTYVVVSQIDQDVTLYFSSEYIKYSITSSSLPIVPTKWANVDSGNSETLSKNTIYYLRLAESYDTKLDYYLTINGKENYETTISVGSLPSTASLYKAEATYDSSFTLPLPSFDSRYHNFIGWFTLENGQGDQITDSTGNSLTASTLLSDQTLYPYLTDK